MKKMVIAIIIISCISLQTQYLSAQEKEETKDSEKSEQQVEIKSAIELKESDQFYYCALEMMGSYEQAGSAFGTLYGEASKQNLVLDMVSFGIYYNNPADTPEEELKWEVGFALPEKREVQEPLKIKKWEYNLLVSKYYDGSFESEEMIKTYQQIFSWIGENSYIPAGPIMEKYLNIPVKNEAGEMCGKIEILVPVQKKE